MTHPGQWLNLYGLTTSAVTNRYFRPTGQWHTGIGRVDYNRTPQCVPSGQTGSKETIWDDETSTPFKFNTCWHSKEEWDCPLVDVNVTGQLFVQPSTFPEGVVYTAARVGAKDATAYNLDNGPLWPTDQTMIAEALSTSHPAVVRDSLNIAQEVGEMVEAFNMVKNLVNVTHHALDILDAKWHTVNWTNPVSKNSYTNAARRFLKGRTFDSLSIRDLAHLAVLLDLGYKFAVKPFVNTMRKLVSIQERTHDILNRFTGEIADLHGTSQRTGTVSFTSTNDPYQKWGNTRKYTLHVWTYLQVKYSSARSDALRDAIKRSLTGRSLRNLPSAAWELTPLSFVVDWFFDFGTYLREMAFKPIDDVSYQVIKKGWTKKTTVISEGWVDPFSSGVYVDHKRLSGCPLVTGSCRKSVYYRQLGTFDHSAFQPHQPEFKMPDLGKLFTLLEVIYAIKNGHKQLIRKA